MADCSYARCVQERRLIKRELQKWTRSMVYIVGLERVAEELMGRRKWKLYQDVLTTSIHHQEEEDDHEHQQHPEDYPSSQEQQQLLDSDHSSVATTTTPTTTANTAALVLQSDTHTVQNNSTVINNGGIGDLPPPNNSEEESKEVNHTGDILLDSTGRLEKALLRPPSNYSKLRADLASGDIGGCQTGDEQPQLARSRSCCKESQKDIVDGQSTPIDWKPQDKCYFCDKGKLLAVNDRGELVPESGSGNTEPDLVNTTPLDSDSDSSEIGSELNKSNFTGTATTSTQQQRAVKHLFKNNPKMTSLESVVGALASMHGIPNVPGLSSFYPSLWHPFAQNLLHQSESGGGDDSSNGKVTNNNGDDPAIGGGGGGGVGTNPEMPLDLSAKSSSTSGLDQKNIFKAKPRMTTISGRRTYTEDELQNALQDILSGKLGTRRAAVLYGIPRSTLRNKVYKLAIEQKREANLTAVAPGLELDDDDKDGSGAEEEKEVERTLSSLPSEDFLRLAAAQGLNAFQKFGKLEEHNQGDLHPDLALAPQQSPTLSKPQTPALPPNLMDPNIILQGLLISGALSSLTNSNNKVLENMLPDFFRNIMLHSELLKSSEGRVKSETPETASIGSTGRSGSDPNEANEELLLKVPSFKPIGGGGSIGGPAMPSTSLPSSSAAAAAAVAAATGYLTKNGESMVHNKGPLSTSSSAASMSRNSPHQQPNILGVSPTSILRQNSESESPPIPGIGSVSLRDVIAKSISKTMQPSNMQMDLTVKKETMDNSPSPGMPSMMDQYKWPTISVKKGLGAEVNRFGGMSAAAASSLLSNNSSLNSQLNNSTGTGGKGTRPKRGKYRNYDRDSLVEAVKAVQRGEMSVHRAGSYYGVPHSTLEYKVKERHLMRPRKREPKPQPMDEGRPTNSNTSSASMKPNDIPSPSAVIRNPMDKSKMMPGAAKSPMKTPPFDPTSPNGMKVPLFMDSATMAAQLHSYSPHMFWQPHPNSFPGMSLDFSRAAGGAGPSSTAGAAAGFPPSESTFAAQMRQRFHEHAANAAASEGNALGTQSNSSGSSGSGNSSANNSKSTTPNSGVNSNNKPPPPLKTAREFAESLYDGASANGAFLDGIIRHSLDRKSGDLHHGTLLDQLVKNNLQFNKDGGMNLKRGAPSPLSFAASMDLKRERASSSDVEEQGGKDADGISGVAKELMVESLLKMRTGGANHERIEDFNGKGNSGGGGGSLGTTNNNNSSYGSNSDSHNAGDPNNLKTRHAILSSSDPDDNEDSS